MKDFEKLQKECLEEIAALGIPIGNITSWSINSRAKSRWGQCRMEVDGTYSIQISEVLLKDDRVSEKACKETMIHEILHTGKDCMKHRGKWKAYATMMNGRYGYKIKRVSSSKDKGFDGVAS